MRKLDMAWINGNIYTADDKFSTAAAFGVSGDRFSVVGSTEEVLENCDEHTKIIDLQGKTVLPGLIDAHLHITNTLTFVYRYKRFVFIRSTICFLFKIICCQDTIRAIAIEL